MEWKQVSERLSIGGHLMVDYESDDGKYLMRVIHYDPDSDAVGAGQVAGVAVATLHREHPTTRWVGSGYASISQGIEGAKEEAARMLAEHARLQDKWGGRRNGTAKGGEHG